MKKKYKIKDREWYENPDNWDGSQPDEWDVELLDILGTIQGGELDSDDYVTIKGYTFDLSEVEEITTDDEEVDFSVSSFSRDRLQSTEYTDKHYNFNATLTPQEIESREIRLDPYRVAKEWRLGQKDDTGCLFHILKGIARFGDKNSVEREITAMEATIKRMKELFLDK